jgi:hypothetical protein
MEHIDDKCHVLTLSMQEEDSLEQLQPSVICGPYSQLVGHLCNIGIHLKALSSMLMPSKYT